MVFPTDIQDLVKHWGIALTGGVATGKSTVADVLRLAGYAVIDADQLARDVVVPGSQGLASIVKMFGTGVLNADQSLDRQRLGQLIFAAPAERRHLEAITHPLIRDALAERLETLGITTKPRPFFYEAALIFETKTQADFREVWATVCSPASQVSRLMKRNNLRLDAAERIIASQMPATAKAALATRVIDTEGTLRDVETQVGQHLEKI